MIKKKKSIIIFPLVGLVVAGIIAYNFNRPQPEVYNSRGVETRSEQSNIDINQRPSVSDTQKASFPSSLEHSKETVIPPKASKLYDSARASVLAGRFEETSEFLHDAYSVSPELIDQTLKDQAFRKYHKEDDFRKLLNIYGRDTFIDLGKGPIILPQ